jgi:hypothetical protein
MDQSEAPVLFEADENSMLQQLDMAEGLLEI